MHPFSRYGVCTVYEARGGRGVIDAPLIQVLPGTRAAGPARTVRCGQDDHLMVHAVMDQVQPGEILVLTMPEPRSIALMGDLMVFQARRRQVAGILVDAAIRDVDEIRALGVPIWTRYICARAAGKKIVGAIGDLSITHKLSSDHHAKFDIGESGKASPDDDVAGWRIVSTCEVTTETCQLDDVVS